MSSIHMSAERAPVIHAQRFTSAEVVHGSGTGPACRGGDPPRHGVDRLLVAGQCESRSLPRIAALPQVLPRVYYVRMY